MATEATATVAVGLTIGTGEGAIVAAGLKAALEVRAGVRGTAGGVEVAASFSVAKNLRELGTGTGWVYLTTGEGGQVDGGPDGSTAGSGGRVNGGAR